MSLRVLDREKQGGVNRQGICLVVDICWGARRASPVLSQIHPGWQSS